MYLQHADSQPCNSHHSILADVIVTMKIGLFYRHIDDADREAFGALRAALESRGVTVCELGEGDSAVGCDYLLSIGGDGTLLSAVQFARQFAPQAIPPIVGVNFGHLGFLTTAGRENPAALADALVQGHFTEEERTLLQTADGHYALNEVFAQRGDSTTLLRTRVYVDDVYVATYAGDGVIVATPTGSTAYSLSCGGPILMSNSRCFVVTPISAHTLTLRPIIVPDTATLRLDVEGGTFTLGIDSLRRKEQGPSSLTLQRAPFTLRLLRLNTQNFFSAIRDKLMWGTEALL